MGKSFQHQVKSILSRTNVIKTQKVQSYILLLPQKMSPFMLAMCACSSEIQKDHLFPTLDLE